MKQKNYRTIIFLGLTGLIAGSLFANIYCSDNVCEWGVFGYNFIEKMQNINFTARNLFQYVFWERVKMWLLLSMLSLTGIGSVVQGLYMVFFGFVSGMTCSITIMEHGFKGTLYFFVLSLAAQLIFLVSVLKAMRAGGFIYEKTKRGANYSTDKFQISNVIMLFWSSVLLLVVSALVETFFNINFVKFWG